MTEQTEHEEMVENFWRSYLTSGEFEPERRQRKLFRVLPGSPRCKNCYAPFQGAGSRVVRFIYGKRPSNLNPQLCNVCEEFARKYQGGAEVELSLLFADVRGSTNLAEGMNPTDYSRVINRFYKAATQVMVQSDALIDKIIGDQVAAMYVPGFAGPEHAKRAVEAAKEILEVTGHYGQGEPWIPIGAGVHTGTAYVGAMGSEEGTTDITVLGDAANTAARLSTNAKQGEILVSEATAATAGLDKDQLEHRTLKLKGKEKPFLVYIL